MVENRLSVSSLYPCEHQCYKENDRLTELPDDVLLVIMSFLTMKEAAKMSVLSHRWSYMWRCFPVLNFEDPSTMKRMYEVYIPLERPRFLRWVDRVLDAHLGPTVDELKVIFYLDKRCQFDMNKWVKFASTKQVKRLELNFTSPLHTRTSPPKWRVAINQHHLAIFKSCLRSLCLKSIDVTSKDIHSLLSSCTILENLCIDCSYSLRYVRFSHSPLQLKHLEISCCGRLETIDILAPKLVSFTHHGPPIELHIRNASLLSEVSVGDIYFGKDMLAYATEPLSNYFSQFVHLSLYMRCYGRPPTYIKINSGINNPPSMTNLKHLELHANVLREESLLGWADLIEASPLLQRLTVKVSVDDFPYRRPARETVRRNGCPLKSLTKLELDGYVGFPIDLEFATYVIDNSVILKDVIVEYESFEPLHSQYQSVLDHVIAKYKRIVPQDAKLTFNGQIYSDNPLTLSPLA